MASGAVATAVEARLRAQWITTPIFIDNEFDQAPQPPAPHVVLEFPGGAAQQVSVGAPGNNRFRETGAFMVHVMVPSGDGPVLARTYADQIAVIFRAQSFSGVNCWAPFPPQESERSNGAYWGASFGTSYYSDLFA